MMSLNLPGSFELREKAGESLGEVLNFGRRELSALGSLEGDASAERLLETLLDCPRSALYLEPDRRLSASVCGEYRRLVALRKQRVPTAYLCGKAFFRNEVLEVSPDCLIPRPETGLMIETVIREIRLPEAFSFLDLGTGSGAIALTLLRHFEKSRGTLTDVSPEALAMARKNLETYGVLDRARFILSDFFEGLGAGPVNSGWDLIVSNPPYLTHEDLGRLQPEVAYEPRIALDGGPDGCEFYRRIIREAPAHLTQGGALVLEAGMGQAGKISGWLGEAGYLNIRIFKDDQGIERVVMAIKGRRVSHG
ncbi:MAG: peptide chain release factor N(5)-glutamine methyltransferase [Candidatus Omnitrophota bacterium]|jgi:release factor glutamine methyltransferase